MVGLNEFTRQVLRTVPGIEKALSEGEPLSAIPVAVSPYLGKHLKGRERSSSFLYPWHLAHGGGKEGWLTARVTTRSPPFSHLLGPGSRAGLSVLLAGVALLAPLHSAVHPPSAPSLTLGTAAAANVHQA